MNTTERAKFDAYLHCAKKAEQAAKQCHPGPAQRMALQLQLSFQSMASSVRKAAERNAGVPMLHAPGARVGSQEELRAAIERGDAATFSIGPDGVAPTHGGQR